MLQQWLSLLPLPPNLLLTASNTLVIEVPYFPVVLPVGLAWIIPTSSAPPTSQARTAASHSDEDTRRKLPSHSS